MKNKIIAVDFDGTLCENKYPEIGVPRLDVIERILKEQQEGAAVILWTCRRREELAAAVYWCLERGLTFDAINDNLAVNIEKFGGDTRKIYADEYWDDRAVLPFEIKATGEREEAAALAADILNVINARVDLLKKTAGELGPCIYEGAEAYIKAGEAETLRDFINTIINGRGYSASFRD